MTTHRGKHEWKSREGEKRTIVVKYQPSDDLLEYLKDMRDALTEALACAYVSAREDNNLVPNPVALRRQVKPWFDSHYGIYAKHHVNPVCRTAVALLRSYRKRHRRLAMPQVRKLAMRIDSELFRVTGNGDGTVTVRVTLKPFNYEYVTFTPHHKKWIEYSAGGEVSEILLTDKKLYVTFIVGGDTEKSLAGGLWVRTSTSRQWTLRPLTESRVGWSRPGGSRSRG